MIFSLHLRRWLAALFAPLPLMALLHATPAAAQSPSERTKITKEDLVRLTAQGIDDQLIINLIRTADEIPKLTPDDVIELTQAGVSQNVLTALTQQKIVSGARRPEITGQERKRRIRVTAALKEHQPGFLGRVQEKDRLDQTQVTWTFAAYGWSEHSPVDLRTSPLCPQDPVCTKRDKNGECAEWLPSDSPDWQQKHGCHLRGKMMKFGEQSEIFEVQLPGAAADAEIHAYFRTPDNEMSHWVTRNAVDASDKRVPGYVKLTLWGSQDMDLNLHIELDMTARGLVQDLKITDCNVINRDEESLQRRILSSDRQYCRVEQAKEGR
jgi:hypothetical protein